MDNMTKTIIELVVIVVAFAIGRYILPRYKVNIQNAAAQFGVLLSYAESFCAYARQFLDCSGSEKMDNVVARLRNICDQQKINIDDETLRAIAQKAYDAMVAGENSTKVIIENAVEELKTVSTETTGLVIDEESSESIKGTETVLLTNINNIE